MKKFLSLFLAGLMLFALGSCAKKTEPETTAPAPETEAEQGTITDEHYEEYLSEEGAIDALELFDVARLWHNTGDQGVLDVLSSYKLTVLETKEDLQPWRSLFEDLTEEDVDAIFGDKKGVVAILELRGTQSSSLYVLDGISRSTGHITLHVREDAAEGENGEYTQFLLYLPGEYYTQEALRVDLI